MKEISESTKFQIADNKRKKKYVADWPYIIFDPDRLRYIHAGKSAGFSARASTKVRKSVEEEKKKKEKKRKKKEED